MNDSTRKKFHETSPAMVKSDRSPKQKTTKSQSLQDANNIDKYSPLLKLLKLNQLVKETNKQTELISQK